MKDKLKKILLRLAENNFDVIVNFPNCDEPLKAKIIEISFRNIDWKPIKVSFESQNLQIEKLFWEETNSFTYDTEPTYGMVKKNVPYREDWIKLEYIELNDYIEL